MNNIADIAYTGLFFVGILIYVAYVYNKKVDELELENEQLKEKLANKID